MGDVTLHTGDCLEWLPLIPDASVDAVVTDPPYPEIDRPYGRLTEAEWWALMVDGVVPQVRRILKPSGSAVFILQPNSRKVGSMRGWLWQFMAWACREWNMVQDAWWWNNSALPLAGSNRLGTLRPSLKACVWLGPADCYRNQSSVLETESNRNRQARLEKWSGSPDYPCGITLKRERMHNAGKERGGVTPFNVLRVPNTNSVSSAGSSGHGAGTPYPVAHWWTRYIAPPGGTVCDPFLGSGTMALAAIAHGCNFVGGDKMPEYMEIAKKRIDEAKYVHQDSLFDE